MDNKPEGDSNSENKKLSEPEFYEEYPKNTPKTLALGRNIAVLSRIAKHFDSNVTTIVGDKGGVLISVFELQIKNSIPIELIQELFNSGYQIKDIKIREDKTIRLLVRENTLGFESLMANLGVPFQW